MNDWPDRSRPTRAETWLVSIGGAIGTVALIAMLIGIVKGS